MEVGLGPSHIVLDGTQLSSPKRGQSPQFSAHFCCCQTAGWMKMALGMEVGLGPGDFVLDGDPCSYPQNKGHTHHHLVFGPCLLWPNGWMDEDATWCGSRYRPRPHCVRRALALRETGTAPPHLFGPCLLWPRSPISATAELWFSIIPGIYTIRSSSMKPLSVKL